jgi:hypothetical protein
MDLIKIPSPIPAIKPVKNLKELLLSLKPRNCVKPSENVGSIIKTAVQNYHKVILNIGKINEDIIKKSPHINSCAP